MGLNIIRTQSQVDNLREYLTKFEYIAYDCETTGLLKTSEVIGLSVCAEESEASYIILKEWDPGTQQLIDLGLDVIPLLKLLASKKLVMHNSVFDCMMAESYFKVSLIQAVHTDTLILAHLLDENRRIGLKELAKQYFGEDSTEEQKKMKASVIANGGKLTKSDYEMFKCNSNIIAKYGAQDALLTFRLFNILVQELFDQGLDKFFYDDESMPLLRTVTYQLNTVGFRVDVPYLNSLKKQLEVECLEAKTFIYSEIKDKIKLRYPGNNKKSQFNIGSSQQLSWLLFGEMGLEFGTLTKEGQNVCKTLGLKLPYTMTAKRDFINTCKDMRGQAYKPAGKINGKTTKPKLVKEPWAYTATDKKLLAKYAPKYKWIARLLEYKSKTKMLETYVLGIEERLRYGIINPSFKQAGTTSGRYSSSNINFQNLPRDDKRVKRCFIARPGKVFVGADYSQLEPRVFAFYSKDERLLKALNGTDDFYSTIGIDTFDVIDALPVKDGHPDAFGVKYPQLRKMAKEIALASTYGAGANKLSSLIGKSADETQEVIDKYFESFPGVRQMMLDAHTTVKTQGYVTNLFGRRRRIPEAMTIPKMYGKNTDLADLPYNARNLLNLSVNHPIQSTGASIVNRSSIAVLRMCDEVGIKVSFVGQVHDSIILECDKNDADAVAKLLEDAMINTVKLEGIRLEAKPKVGTDLSEV